MTEDPELSRLRAENQALRQRLAAFGPTDQGSSALRQAFPSLLEAMPAFIVRLDDDLCIRYVNRLQPGLTREDTIGRSVMTFLPPAFHGVARSTIEQVRASGEPARYETFGEGANGETAFYETYVTPVSGSDGAPAIWLIAVDITEHRARQLALADSEQRLRFAVESTGIGLWEMDVSTGSVTWDDRMRAICGRDRPLAPRQYLEIVHPADREKVSGAFSTVEHTGEWNGVSHRLVHDDGTVRWIMPMGRVLRENDKPTRILGALLDVSAQHALEDTLREAQKLQAVGRLTAGIAHNFNNLLAVLLPSLDLLAPAVPPGHRDLVADASHAAQRAAELVRQLMAFAGQRRGTTRRNADVHSLVDAALAICVRTFERHIKIETEFEPGLPPVHCDAGDIEQVLLNLLLNARDAIAEAPGAPARVRVETGIIAAPPERIAQGDSRRLVCIRVRDTGTGISEEVRAMLFEPFFTTKPVGRGTGLGLATSFAIMREHGGWMTCDSQLGEGATFSIFLPESESLVSAPKPPMEATTAVASGHVLVVDDEDLVRRVVRRVLEASGCTVTTAADGKEALAQLERTPDVGVILLDRSLGETPGERLLPDLRRRAPTAKIVLFTGQTVEAELEARVDGVLLKPVRPDQLTRVVFELLQASERTSATRTTT